ncbi:MAG: serine hydrolase domain-containing protein [Planctomycetota bacterium]
MNSLTWRLVLLLVVALAPLQLAVAQDAPAPPAQPATESTRRLTDDEVLARVRSVAETDFKSQQLVGLAVGVIRTRQFAGAVCLGHEDREANVAVTRDTRFRWASLSKPVTATAAMQLRDAGKLDLDADVRTLVPEFPDPGEGRVITTRQLLCHQSGIVHYANGKVVRDFRKQYDSEHPFESVINALDYFRLSPLVAAPGTAYNYSTHALILASAVVERAGGQPFWQQVRTRIVEKAKLPTLQPDYQWVDIPHRAVGYVKRGERIVRGGNTDVSWKLGGGGFISNVDDMAGFAVAMINRQLVSEESERLMWTRQKTSDGKATSAGLGFFISGSGDDLRVSHSGAQEKTRTWMVFLPRRGFGVVLLTNSEYASLGELAGKLLAVLATAEVPVPESPVEDDGE